MFIIEISCAAAAVMLLLMLYGEFLRMGGEERDMRVNAPEFDEDGFEICQVLYTGSEFETHRDALTGSDVEIIPLAEAAERYHQPYTRVYMRYKYGYRGKDLVKNRL